MDSGPDDESHLWQAYRRDGDRAAQTSLFQKYVPWSRAVARDVYRRVRIMQMDWADYAQNATVGLLEAMGRFDPARGIEFPAYAKPRVRGAVFNGLRCFLDDNQHGRTSGPSQPSDRLSDADSDGSEDLLSAWVSAVSGLAVGFMLDSAAYREHNTLDAEPSQVLEQQQLESMLREVVAALPDNQRMVVELHYFQYLPFVEISRLMGLTKGRISQIHSAAIEKCIGSAVRLSGLDRCA